MYGGLVVSGRHLGSGRNILADIYRDHSLQTTTALIACDHSVSIRSLTGSLINDRVFLTGSNVGQGLDDIVAISHLNARQRAECFALDRLRWSSEAHRSLQGCCRISNGLQVGH